MSYNMNKECKRQELASRLVEREVYYCVSSLVSDLSTLVQEAGHSVGLSWEDDILPLLEWIGYEEALRYHVMEDADVDDIEELVNECSYWDAFLDDYIYPDLGKPPRAPSILADKLCVECHMEIQGCPFEEFESEDRRDDVLSSVEAYDSDNVYCDAEHDEEFSRARCDCCGSTLAGARYVYEHPVNMEDQSIDDWLDADEERNKKFREQVCTFLEKNGSANELCSTFNIDTDDYRSEVYEHWIVSNWLASKLSESGHITGDLCGLTIWGRGCTGQAIALDHVIQEIACEVYNDEWKEFLSTLTTSEQSDV